MTIRVRDATFFGYNFLCENWKVIDKCNGTDPVSRYDDSVEYSLNTNFGWFDIT